MKSPVPVGVVMIKRVVAFIREWHWSRMRSGFVRCSITARRTMLENEMLANESGSGSLSKSRQ